MNWFVELLAVLFLAAQLSGNNAWAMSMMVIIYAVAKALAIGFEFSKLKAMTVNIIRTEVKSDVKRGKN